MRQTKYWFPGNMKKQSTLKKVSSKRAAQLRVYYKLRQEFLKEKPYCQIFEPCCTRKAVDVHHVKGRNGNRLVDKSWWIPACRPCHRFLHDRPAYARSAGFLK
jgi:hypothetical protein